MQWDVFCRVIDNHGDLGVCWRLACDLATRGERVRLWVDDPSALPWMAPDGHPGVKMVDWSDRRAVACHVAGPLPDMLIEAFGCDPDPGLLARFAARRNAEGAAPGGWVNLEYLSAEPVVDRLHLLPSPVFHGPGAGLVKTFFYPGFTDRTGGLLREPDLMARRRRFDRAAWLSARGIDGAGERLVSMFCYEPEALQALLGQLAAWPRPTRLLVAAGRSAQALAHCPDTVGALSIERLPHLSQRDFDHLLWACDLNFVRGEDSWIRAIWAGAPFVWQIYPQDDQAHHAKLDAFLGLAATPLPWRQVHHAWNGVGGQPLPVLGEEVLRGASDWSAAERSRLLTQDDLVTRLLRFAAQKS